MSPIEIYSIGEKITFWVVWLICLGSLLLFLFVFFPMIRIGYLPIDFCGVIIAGWNVMGILAQSIILLNSAKQFFLKAKPVSMLIQRLAFITFGMPFLAYGGCTLVTLARFW
ncbi:hypothetical protein [Methylovulum psychrotolerans]|uniref:Uncharacterized protein n=1 Tax=Methylovulum psychrotolerans TaxID=1704499 RepID=A0A2S5CLS4_9GAMM|nr:hypothetical protein [Methylovulum psychrotolerans]POZ51744.1 hypothetical protein AADEFJLK_02618 [Methylovulum psychrotolerans]